MRSSFLARQDSLQQGRNLPRTSTIFAFHTAFCEEVANWVFIWALATRCAFYTVIVVHITDWVGL